MNPKMKKIIEQILVDYEAEFREKFGDEAYDDMFKHRNKVTEEAMQDNVLVDILKAEVEDCVDAYLTKKYMKGYRRKNK